MVIAVKNKKAVAINGNIIVRSYGNKKAITAYPQGDSVVVNHVDGSVMEYRMKDGIVLRKH